MKKLYYLICIACALITLSLNVRADVTIRFWDNGELVHSATEDQPGNHFFSEYYSEHTFDGKLVACDGYNFVGWRVNNPILDEAIYASDGDALVTDHTTVADADINLFAVYRKDVTCYNRISSADNPHLAGGNKYLIVGKGTGDTYYAMSNEDLGASTSKYSGLTTSPVTPCGNIIYSVDASCIWLLSGNSNGNYKLRNISSGEYLYPYYMGSTYDKYKYLTQSNDSLPLTFTVSNGTWTLKYVESYTYRGRTYYYWHLANFAIENEQGDISGYSNIFTAGYYDSYYQRYYEVPKTPGDIYIYKQGTEYRYRSKCGQYTVSLRACGDNSCGEGVSVTPPSLTEPAPTLVTCAELEKYSTVNPNSVTPTVCTERWTFKGWAEKPQEKTTTDPRDSYVGDSYVLKYQGAKLYAVYRHKKYDATTGTVVDDNYWSSYPTCSYYVVNFDPGTGTVNGSGAIYPMTENPMNSGIELPTASACGSWTFAGWSTTACANADVLPEGLKAAGSRYYPTSDGEKFYAVYSNGTRWTTYPVCVIASVTLNAGTGTVDGQSTKVLTETNVGDGVPLISASSGCTFPWVFAGWSHSPVATTNTQPSLYAQNTTYHPISANDILYAVYVRGTGSNQVWTSSPSCNPYNVILHACSGNTCDYSSVGGNPTYTLIEGSIGSGVTFIAATTTCDGRWEFAGWHKDSPITHKYTTPDDLYEEDDHYTPTQDNENFYAVYKHKTRDYWTSDPDCALYTVHLHACEGTLPGGASDGDVEEEVAGQGVDLPTVTPLCTARGWAFIGWVEGGDLATTRNVDDVHIITENTYVPLRDNINLYAVYSVSGYKRVTTYEELEDPDDVFVIAFYWNYGNAYSYENFALSNSETHISGSTYYINLTPIEGYTDADGNHYVADPASNNACKWKLVSDNNGGYYFRNVANNTLYVASDYNSANLRVRSSYYRTAFTINLEGHCIERKSYTDNYRFWHFINDGVGSVPNPKFYAYQDKGPDQCYLYHQTNTLYSSWPHCEEYMVYFDGCDGISEKFTLTEEDAGMGVPVPNVTDICEGWAFAGWGEEAYNEKVETLTQNLYPAGSTYVPKKNKVTLYAVYYQPKDEFNEISSLIEMYSGAKYLIVHNDAKVMSNTLASSQNGGITAGDVTPAAGKITNTSTAWQWQLIGQEGNYTWYNPAATKYLDMNYTVGNNIRLYLQDDPVDNFRISIENNYFLVLSNNSRRALYYSTSDYFSCFLYDGDDSYLKFYRQAADYWSYPCSKPAEAVKWGDGQVVIESLTLSGTPTKESAVIIEPITPGEDGTYVITHTARPGRRMRFGWGTNNYYYLKVPYIATPTYTPAVENLPNNDLVLLPNSTFAVEVDTWLHSVSVYDDATLVIANDNTLTVDTLYLRSEGPGKMPNVIFGGNNAEIVINSGVVYFDYRIDDSQYYPFGLPYDAQADEVTYAGLIANTAVPELYTDYYVQYYDGPSRAATNGVTPNRTYWTHLVDPASTLIAGEGYGIGINDIADNHKKRTLRFKMTPGDRWNDYETESDRVVTIKPSKTDNKQHSGWNFVTNPYLHTYYPGNADASSNLLTGYYDWVDGKWQLIDTDHVPYLTFYDLSSNDYYQTTASVSSIAPFSQAFVQVEEYDKLHFTTPIQAADNAPVRKATPEVRIVRSGILLREKQAEEKENETPTFDETGLVISNRYTNSYEVGVDLVKQYNPNFLHVFTYNDAYKLAFNALDEQSAAQPIPVGVSVPKTDSYTFCFDNRQYDIDVLEALYLTDKQQNKTVDLLDENYTCTIEKGTNEERFVINVILKPEKEDPTNMEAAKVNGLRVLTNTDGSITLYNSSNMTNVQAYDVAGRLLGEWKPNTYQWTVNLPQGVYAVSVQDAQNQITHVKICSK